MKNPLTKRLPRELKSEFGKYLVIFLLLIISIGFVSGFLVADGSMIRTYNEGFQKYNIENGHFQVAKKATTSQIQAIEENDITLYENFYSEESITNGSTLRIFSNRTDVNLVCLMKGDFPSITYRRIYICLRRSFPALCRIALRRFRRPFASIRKKSLTAAAIRTVLRTCVFTRSCNAWM